MSDITKSVIAVLCLSASFAGWGMEWLSPSPGAGGAFDAKLTVLLPAKAGKFPGCIKHLRLEWDGTQFTGVHEM